MQSVNTTVRRVNEELFGSEIAGLMETERSPRLLLNIKKDGKKGSIHVTISEL